ncbi:MULTISPECIES: protein translocase subunit SecF [Cetobacterium]|jgi:preprotein translocase subunit SecF|uniref:Protein-export membrane protein SecF n=1 Tax=Candidatus Cetobacterium colombiensis TaxID=3073100 RepID=A0ABU4W9X9_9FUSO|nr:protein translocase subunit SecF [Candidatus Cetobacterium colombiensis]MDX8336345.1 protein translocase subunit SecF [Candidatus Cetobacterium colombiensis]
MYIEVIKHSKKWITLSTISFIIFLGMFLIKGLNYGIDFTGGSLIQLNYTNSITLADINKELDGLSVEIPQLTSTARKVQVSQADNNVIIRTPEMSDKNTEVLLTKLQELGEYKLERAEKVGATIGEELKTSAIYALSIGGLLIVLYITMRYEFKFAIAGILTLLHDVTAALGVIALLGYEVDTPFIAAILTILGYSINDTIIIYDRIRESLRKKSDLTFGEVLNKSLNQVLVRSINTSVTTLLALVAILVFGGDSLRTFTTTLLVGIGVGTYSSIYISTPLVYLFEKKRDDKYEPKKDDDDDSHPEEKIVV